MAEAAVEKSMILTIQDLQQASYDLVAPLRLQLQDTTVYCYKILRHLRGKRLTAVVELCQQRVVLKLFYGRGLRHIWHAYRDARGIQKLRTAKLPTPALVALQFDRHYSYVAYQYLGKAISLQYIWQHTAHDQQKKQCLDVLMPLIAAMHQQGLWQADLHFDNFLVYGNQYYLIDGAAIKGNGKKPLSKATRVQNLGLLLAQIPRHQAAVIDHAIQRYITASNGCSTMDPRYFETQRWHRETNYLARTNRTCADFTRKVQFKYVMMSTRSPLGYAAQQFLEHLIANPNCQPMQYLKQGLSSTLMQVRLEDDDTAVLKRYNIKSKGHALRKACRPSRAANSWQFGQLLQFLEIATPMPLAMLECRWGILRGRAYILYQYQQGLPLDQFIAMHYQQEQSWQTVMRSAVEVLQQLAAAHLIHGDLKASNFLVTSAGIQLLDLDSMRRIASKRYWQYRWRKDKRRFLANFLEHANIAAYIAMLLQQVNL